MGISRARRMPSGLLTVWGTRPRVAFPVGQTSGTDSQFPANCAGKLGVSPGFAAYSGPPPPKPLSTLGEGAHGGAVSLLLGQSDAPAGGRAHGAFLRCGRSGSRGGGSRPGSRIPSNLAASFRYFLLDLVPPMLETD